MATKKSPVKKKTRSARKGEQKRTVTAKPSPKKKSVAKKPPALRKEEPPRVEGARSLLKGFREKKRVKSLFALETREDLQGKTVAELRAIAREAGIGLKGRLKAEVIGEIAGGLDLFPKVRKKPSVKMKPSPDRKKAAPARKRVIRPARPILKEKPAVKVKEMEVEAVLPEAPEVLVQREEMETLVEKALGDVLKEEAGKEEIGIALSREEYAAKPSAREMAAKKSRDVDRVTAVAVDPHTVFVDWDMSEKTAKRGRPAMRVYDVTGVEFDGKNYREFADVQLPGRSGESFIVVRPEREYIVDAGVVDTAGRFMPARRTSKVTTPPETAPEGPSLLPDEYFRFGPGDYGHR